MQSVIKDIFHRSKRLIRYLLGTDLLQGPQVKLLTERHGSEYGGWVITPHGLNQSSVVYSFGVGDDVSFDVSLIEHYGLTVHAFDPTPRSVAWVEKHALPEQFVFHQLGVASIDGTMTFHAPVDASHMSYSLMNIQGTEEATIEAPVRRLRTIMTELGHDHIDLMKMDIEGAEYDVLADLIHEGLEVPQLLVEFHHRFASVGIEKTREALNTLNRNGYKIFSVSPTGEEYSFIRV